MRMPDDSRTPNQFIQSVLAYVDFRAGRAWRPVSHRWHPDRMHWLKVYRIISFAFDGDARKLGIELSDFAGDERIA